MDFCPFDVRKKQVCVFSEVSKGFLMEIIDLTQKNDKVGGSANLPARPEDVLAKRTRASQNGIIRRTGDSLARNGLADKGYKGWITKKGVSLPVVLFPVG